MALMNYEDVQRLVEKLIGENPGVSVPVDTYIAHVLDAGDAAKEALMQGSERNPILGVLDIDEIGLATRLHDIGRILNDDQMFHELRGAKWIEEYGVEYEVTDSQEQAHRLAQMIRPHFVVSEQFLAKGKFQDQREEFRHLSPELLIPQTWSEALVVYGDASNCGGKRVPIEECLAYIDEGYGAQPEVKEGLPRVIEIYDKVQASRERVLADSEIEWLNLEDRSRTR